jgi:hypothetical protein
VARLLLLDLLITVREVMREVRVKQEAVHHATHPAGHGATQEAPSQHRLAAQQVAGTMWTRPCGMSCEWDSFQGGASVHTSSVVRRDAHEAPVEAWERTPPYDDFEVDSMGGGPAGPATDAAEQEGLAAPVEVERVAALRSGGEAQSSVSGRKRKAADETAADEPQVAQEGAPSASTSIARGSKKQTGGCSRCRWSQRGCSQCQRKREVRLAISVGNATSPAASTAPDAMWPQARPLEVDERVRVRWHHAKHPKKVRCG